MGRLPKEKNNKEEENNNQEDLSKNTLNALLKGHSEDHYNYVYEKPYSISTGSLILDGVLGGSVASGTSIRLTGPFSSGKTSQAFLLMYNYLNTVPNSKGIYIKAESRLSKDLKERTGLNFVYSAENWNVNTVFIYECNIFEAIASTLEGLLKTMFEQGQHLCIILDSLDQCILRKDLTEKDIENGMKVAGIPLMTKLFYRRLGLPINKYNALMVLVSQQSANISLNPYAGADSQRPINASGGAAAAHCMDIILEYTPKYNKHMILENPDEKPDSNKNKIIGHKCPLIIRKATNERENTSLELNIKHGQKINSFWKEMDVAEFILSWDLAKRTGKTIEFCDSILKQAQEAKIELKDKIVGMNNFYKYFEENSVVCDWFYSKFKELQN